MIAFGAFQLAALECDLRSTCLQTLAARPSHALADLLVHQLLPTMSPGPAQHGLLARCAIPVRHDHRVCRALPQDVVPLLPTGNDLSLIPFRWFASALAAVVVFAAVAIARLVEFVATLVTLPVDAHADRLVDAEDVAFHLVPGMGVHLETEPFGELPGTLGVELGPEHSFSLKAS